MALFADWCTQFWIIAATLIAPPIFLSALPRWHTSDWRKKLSQPAVYPGIFRGLVDYILLPLAGLFVLILYVYLISILIKWEWPKEGVAT